MPPEILTLVQQRTLLSRSASSPSAASRPSRGGSFLIFDGRGEGISRVNAEPWRVLVRPQGVRASEMVFRVFAIA